MKLRKILFVFFFIIFLCPQFVYLGQEKASLENLLKKELLGKSFLTKIPLGKKYSYVDEEGYKFTLKVITEIYPDEIRYFGSGGLTVGTRNYGSTQYITPKFISGRPAPPSEVETIPEETLMQVKEIKQKEDGIEITLKRGNEEAKIKLMKMNMFDIDTAMSMLERVFEIDSVETLDEPQLASSLQSEIERMSSLLSEKIVTSGKKSVAVVDFLDLVGNITEFGKFLAEEFSVAFSSIGAGFEVIDRTHLKTLLEEHKLSATGLVDPETTKQLGKIIGVEALVTGSITPLERTVRISVKILDTSTARLIGAASGEIVKTKDIAKMVENVLESKAYTQPLSSQTESNLGQPIIKESADGFIFEIKSCQQVGTSVICNLTVTNMVEIDRNLQMPFEGGRGSRFIDEFGNEYYATSMQFGNKMLKRDDWPYNITNTMVPNTPTKLVLFFENIRTKPNKISMLEILFRSGYDLSSVRLRNIPINR